MDAARSPPRWTPWPCCQPHRTANHHHKCGGSGLYMDASEPNPSSQNPSAPAAALHSPAPPATPLHHPPGTCMDLPPPPPQQQHLLDQIEKARRSALWRYRGSLSRRTSTSPAWIGMPHYRAPERLLEEVRRTMAYSDDSDPERDAYAAGVTAGSVDTTASPPSLAPLRAPPRLPRPAWSR